MNARFAGGKRSVHRFVRDPVLFVGSVVLLVIINLLVWLWLYPANSLVGRAHESDGLRLERARLLKVISATCDSDIIDVYHRERRSALGYPLGSSLGNDGSQNFTADSMSEKMSYVELLSLLQQSSVRILTSESYGSGFFIDEQRIVTNRHVVEPGLNSAIFAASKSLGPIPVPVRVVAMTENAEIGEPDFAVLQLLQPVATLSPLRLAPDPTPLSEVIAVGFPGLLTELDVDQVTPSPIFSSGRVTTVKAQPSGTDFVFHTADISSGNSGGPLVNFCGEVVGVNTFVIAENDHIGGRALSALSPSSLRHFLDKHGIAYQLSAGGCRG